jgi:hypothetical protein
MTRHPDAHSMTDALRAFENTEANLRKAEVVWDRLSRQLSNEGAIADIVTFDSDRQNLERLFRALPPIAGFRPTTIPPAHDELTRLRIDYLELDDCYATLDFHASLHAPGQELRDYRNRFGHERRRLVRARLEDSVASIESSLAALRPYIDNQSADSSHTADPAWANLQLQVDAITTLAGKDADKLSRWYDLRRHLRFAMQHDLRDIIDSDWPAVRTSLQEIMYGDDDPVPCRLEDLSVLAGSPPAGPVPGSLNWDRLNSDQFEELIYHILKDAVGYENAQLLMKTNAADKGRDVSVERVRTDSLSGTIRERIIVQCKHFLSKSVSLPDVHVLPEQVKLWEPPPVDTVILATSSRFTPDVVKWVENRNAAGSRPKIEMWPDKHIESLLAMRAELIARFGLR